MTTEIKVLLLDVGGILAQDAYNELLERLLVKTIDSTQYVTPKDIYTLIMTVANKCWNDYKVGKCDEEVFWNTIVNQSPIAAQFLQRGLITDEKDIVQIVKLLKSELRAHHMKPYDQAIDFFVQIRKEYNDTEHVVFAVLSNHTVEWLPFIFESRSAKLDIIFTNKNLIYNSAHIGLAKPDIKAFEHVLQDVPKQLNKDPSQLKFLFIDDKLANVESARKAGMEGYQFHSGKMSLSDLRSVIEEFLNRK
jgi:FMN phosphatase YigB (HAD superfamily)